MQATQTSTNASYIPVSLSVFVPFYNEEDNIQKCVETILLFLRNNQRISDFEIIIVNDGSTDNTAHIAHVLEVQNEEVSVVSHAFNKGYGAALASGFQAAQHEYIFFTDGDLQFDINDLNILLNHLPEFKVVLGYREYREDPLVRRVYAYGWNFLNATFFGLKVRDINCAFKLFRSDCVKDFQCLSNGAMFSSELLIRLKLNNVEWKEVSVTHLPRKHGAQTGGNFIVVFQALKEFTALYVSEVGKLHRNNR